MTLCGLAGSRRMTNSLKLKSSVYFAEAEESLTAGLPFTRSFPPTSSNGEVIRAARPGRSNSSLSRVIKTMSPLFL